jgi:hypothetical protein
MTTYSELVTQIRDYTETSSDVLSDTIINDFIEHTENKILRDLDLPVFRSYQYATFTASNGFLTLPGGTSITPVEFSIIRSVMIYPAAGSGARTYLEQRDVTFMNEYWPNRATTSTPKYYSQWDENTIYVVPTPDAAYYCELGLNKLPTRLSSSNTSTWVSNNAPALLLYGCLVEAFKFLKGSVEMLQLYQQSYETALQEVAAQQQGRGRRDEYMSGVIRVPRPSFEPTLGSIKTPIQGGQ